jgi:hypothetical protein
MFLGLGPLETRPICSAITSVRAGRSDHVVVLGEAHLRRMLQSYARYYNEIRTRRSPDYVGFCSDVPQPNSCRAASGIVKNPDPRLAYKRYGNALDRDWARSRSCSAEADGPVKADTVGLVAFVVGEFPLRATG